MASSGAAVWRIGSQGHNNQSKFPTSNPQMKAAKFQLTAPPF
jgi:hypothetical protein